MEKEDKIDNISFKWPKSVMVENEKAILYSAKYENKEKISDSIYLINFILENNMLQKL